MYLVIEWLFDVAKIINKLYYICQARFPRNQLNCLVQQVSIHPDCSNNAANGWRECSPIARALLSSSRRTRRVRCPTDRHQKVLQQPECQPRQPRANTASCAKESICSPTCAPAPSTPCVSACSCRRQLVRDGCCHCSCNLAPFQKQLHWSLAYWEWEWASCNLRAEPQLPRNREEASL